jgi:dihydropteroate synthase
MPDGIGQSVFEKVPSSLRVMSNQYPTDVSRLSKPLAPMVPALSAERRLLSTRHGELDFTRRTLIMGIVNVTPDSFYDGGRRFDVGQAVAHGLALAASGADIIDIGGESSRPGADPVSAGDELARVISVIENLRKQSAVPISIDTYKAQVARAALDAGADIVNDISALRFDSAMTSVIAQEKVPVILMHMQGTPRTMQAEPRYQDVVREVRDFLAAQLYEAMDAGVAPAGDRHRSGHRFRQKPRAQFATAARAACLSGTRPAGFGRCFAQGFHRQDFEPGTRPTLGGQSRCGGCRHACRGKYSPCA